MSDLLQFAFVVVLPILLVVGGLASLFAVSEQAMEIRLGTLHLLSPLIVESG